MNTPVLVIALNSGLRNRVGHVTFVSSDLSDNDDIADKIRDSISRVKASEVDMTLDDRFIGVRTLAIQDTSGRDAPEATMLWNVDRHALSEDKIKLIEQWLKQIAQRRRELLDEPESSRSSKTIMFSPTVEDWFKAYFSDLPASDLWQQRSSDRQVVTLPHPKPLRRSASYFTRSVFVGSVLLAMIGLWAISKQFAGRNIEKKNDFPGTETQSQNEPHSDPSVTPPSKKLFDEWKKRLDAYDTDCTDAISVDEHIKRLRELFEEADAFPSSQKETIELAKAEISTRAGGLATRINRDVETDISRVMKQISEQKHFEELQRLPSLIDRGRNLLIEVRQWSSTAGDVDASRPQSQLDRAVLTLLVEQTESFSRDPDLRKYLVRDQIEWLVAAAKAKAEFARCIKNVKVLETIEKQLDLVGKLAGELVIVCIFEDADTHPMGNNVKLFSKNGSELFDAKIEMEMETHAIGGKSLKRKNIDNGGSVVYGRCRVPIPIILTSTKLEVNGTFKDPLSLGGLQNKKFTAKTDFDDSTCVKFAWNKSRDFVTGNPGNGPFTRVWIEDSSFRVRISDVGKFNGEAQELLLSLPK